MLKRFLPRSAAFVLAAMISTPVLADMGPLESVLPNGGVDGPWRFERRNGNFALHNPIDSGAVKYFYLNVRPEAEGSRAISVDVSFSGGDGIAGLLYGLDQSANTYFLYVMEAGGAVSFYHRTSSGFRRLLRSETKGPQPEVNRLTLREAGREVRLFKNGERVGAMTVNGTGKGAVGVAAAGTVSAVLDNFALEGPDANAAPPKAKPVAGKQSAAVRLKPVQIDDEQGPVGRMVAYSTVIPADWQPQGGIVWNPPTGCHSGARLVWGAGTQDKKTGVAMMPPVSWAASNYGRPGVGCMAADLPDAAVAAQAYLQALPGLQTQIQSIERPPELQAVVRELSQALPQSPGRQWHDAVLVRMRASYEGVETDAAMIFLSQHYEVATPDGWGQGGMMQLRGGVSASPIVISMPVGEFDMEHPGVVAILSNLRPNPRWLQAVAQWTAQQRQARRAAAGGAVADAGSSVGDIMFDGWKRREAMKDKGQSNYVHSIHETQDFRTPSGQVTLSQHYNQTWRLADGTFVQTNDAFFNPNQTFGQDGSRLQPIR